MDAFTLPTFIVAHVMILLALMVLFAVLSQITQSQSIRKWFYSDIFALLAVVIFNQLQIAPDFIIQIGFALTCWIVAYFRIIALCSPEFSKSFQQWAISAILLMLAINPLIGPSNIKILVFANTIFFSLLIMCEIYVLLWQNKNKNKLGKILILTSTAAMLIVSLFRAGYIINTGETIAFNATTFNTLVVTTILMLSFFAHAGIIIIEFEEISRGQSEAKNALLREAEKRQEAETHERENAILAEEQNRLIEVLTHEVRQPLNNASAALESISIELTELKLMGQFSAIVRAQAVIDKVGLALSNALIAATILERRQKFNPVRVELMPLLEMVVMDFTPDERRRIQLSTDTSPLYVTVDPILLRIALRNLIDNALRYSPHGSDISLSVCENEAERGANFHISNIDKDPNTLIGDEIFDRRVRSLFPESQGSGMGLYITAEIAKLHSGWVRMDNDDERRTFTMFLED